MLSSGMKQEEKMDNFVANMNANTVVGGGETIREGSEENSEETTIQQEQMSGPAERTAVSSREIQEPQVVDMLKAKEQGI